MSQLHTLFQTLDEKEFSVLNSLRLIGKEKEVYDLIRKHSQVSLPEIDVLLRTLSITDTHYYKINSVLLRKCYQELVPAQGLELLQYLKIKNLFSLLRHEILTQDKKSAAKKNAKEQEVFYLGCFHYFIDFPYKFYDKKMTDAFGEKYLRSKTRSSESDKLYVQYHKLFSDVNRLAAKKNPQKALGLTADDLHAFEKKLSGTEHHLATYYLYRSFCSYYTYYEKNNEKLIEYLKKAISLKDKISFFFPINIGQFLQLLYADALFHNNKIKEAEEIYTKAFKDGVSENMYGYYYHCEQYTLVSIILKRYEQSQQFLNKVFQPCIDNRMDIHATRGAMCFVKLYLSNGDLKQASSYLNIAKNINEKTFYLPFDVQLRVLENIYFFLKRDHEFAMQLANRNIKFLRAQEHATGLNDYLLLWKTIIGLLNSIDKGTEIEQTVLQDHERLSKQYRNLYCNLIEKLLEHTKMELE